MNRNSYLGCSVIGT